MSDQPKKSNAFLKMLTWWKTDELEIKNQVTNYKTLSIGKSARKVSSLLLLFSTTISIIFVIIKSANSNLLLDAMLTAILAIFVFLGHRWALLFAMIYWTFSKAYLISTGTNPVVQIIWWALFMSQFYLAFRVEVVRRKVSDNVPNSLT